MLKEIKTALLTNPPTGLYDRYERCQAPIESEFVRIIRPPLDLMYLASILERNGVKVEIRDYPIEGGNSKLFIEKIKSIRPDLLLVSSTTATYSDDCYFIKIAKEIDNSIIAVLKGVFPERGAEVILEHPEVDFIIGEESEFILEEIIQKKRLNDIAGLTYRDNGKVIANSFQDLSIDLDALPFPARHLVNNDLYLMPDTGKRMGLILASKGCPFECIFCLAPIVDGKVFRLRSPESLVKEIEECISKYRITEFWFRADSFTINRKWVTQVCQMIIDRKLKIRWATNSRADAIDEEMLVLLKRAGCFALGFGVESGSEETLKRLKKKITKEQSRRMVALCRKFGIQTYLFFVIGFPWETESDVFDTIEFAKELNGDVFNFSVATPFRGTELFDEFRSAGLLGINKEVVGFDYSRSLTGTIHIKSSRLADIEKIAYRRIIFRPGYLLKTLRNIKSPIILINYIKAAYRLRKILF